MRMPQAFAALCYRDFRLLWIGQFISMFGVQLQTVALSWLIYVLTGSTAQLGGIAIARAVPTVLLSLFGGTLADQVDRRKLLLVTQSTAATLLLALALLVSTGRATTLTLYLFAMAISGAMAFDSPARQALIPALVPRERLTNALTLNVLASDSASILGPALGGVLISTFGTAACFWLNALTYLLVVVALTLMHPPKQVVARDRRSLAALVEGLRFVRQRPILWQLMLLDFLATALVSSVGLLPVFARDIFRIGPEGLGWLYTALSVGAVSGELLVAFLRTPRHPGRVMVTVVIGYGLALGLFGLAPWLPLALVLLALAGGLDAISMVMRHTVRQLVTPDDYRGRVGALASLFALTGPRLGQFQAGLLASVFGARLAMALGGAACVLVAVLSRWWAPGLWADDYALGEPAPPQPAHAAASDD
ncbi:MAG: MFS transporter [Thermorudis peleae]|nr:MFS transporter [Thermorudis peleae]